MNTEVETAAYALGKRSAGVRWAQHPREAPPRDHEDRGTGLLSVQGACPTSTRGRGPRRLRAPRLWRPAPRFHASNEGARGVNSGLLAVVAKPVPAVPSCPEASGSCLRATPERRSQVPARPLAPCGNPTPPWGHPRYPSFLPAVFDVARNETGSDHEDTREARGLAATSCAKPGAAPRGREGRPALGVHDETLPKQERSGVLLAPGQRPRALAISNPALRVASHACSPARSPSQRRAVLSTGSPHPRLRPRPEPSPPHPVPLGLCPLLSLPGPHHHLDPHEGAPDKRSLLSASGWM